MAKGILISFAGYPYTSSSLMPDNGLATLAGALISSGHKALIIDYGTVECVKRLMPEKYRGRLAGIYRNFEKKRPKNLFKRLNDINLFINLKILSKKLESFQAAEVGKMGGELLGIIEKEKPDFIGFKLWVGGGFDGSLKMAKMIRENFPDIKLFAGGPAAAMSEETIYEITDVFDSVCYQEGEETIVSLAEYACGKRKTLEDIPNIIYRDKGTVKKNKIRRLSDLDNMPLPVYDEEIYPAMKGDSKIKVFVIDESRGCPYHCNFCPHSEISGSAWRVKGIGRIIKELEAMVKRYNVHAFRYAGSCTPAKVVEGVASHILASNLDVVYASFAHVRTTNTETLALLKKSGLYALFFGIESGDRRILEDVMAKKATPEDIKNTMKACIRAGIFTVGSIIYPSPGETSESRENTMALLMDIFKEPGTGSVPIQFAGLYPRTEWYKNPGTYGFKIKHPATYLKDMTDYKIKALFPPQYWDPLPYTIDGKSYRRFSQETIAMIEDLEDRGILTAVSDEIALIGALAGLSPREYRDRVRFNFYCGDWAAIKEEVKTVNRNLSDGREIREKIRSCAA